MVSKGIRAGYDICPNNPKYYGDWSPDDFVNPQAVAKTSELLGGSPGASQFMANLTMTPLSTNSVRLDYNGNSNPDETQAILKAYAGVILNQREDREATRFSRRSTLFRAVTPQTARIKTNENVLARNLQQPGNFSSYASAKPNSVQKVAARGPRRR